MSKIFDGYGRVARYSIGDYEAAKDNRERTLYGGKTTRSQTESEHLPFTDRLRIISYLRRAIRNNPIVASLCYRYALLIGSPTVKSRSRSGSFNDLKERVLEKKLRKIVWPSAYGWADMHRIISIEELIAGECFVAEVEDGVQLVPAELVGSPPGAPRNETDGIGYDEDGVVLYYRVGVRLVTGIGGQTKTTRISYEERDGATLVDAQYVHHLGQGYRIEEARFSPKLAPVISMIQHLDDIIKAKVTTVKNQSAMSMFLTKNFAPEMFAESMADAVSTNAQEIMERALAQSRYQSVNNGQIVYGEVGEDLKLIEPKMNATDFSDFALFLLDQICGAIGMSPEEVVTGYRKSNYSSARADRLRLSSVLGDIRSRRDNFCDSVIARQISIAVDEGLLPPENETTTDLLLAWPPVREIDEQKHIAAQSQAVGMGIKSLDMVHAEAGVYTDQVQLEQVQSAARIARLVRAHAANLNPSAAEVEATQVSAAEIRSYLPTAPGSGGPVAMEEPAQSTNE